MHTFELQRKINHFFTESESYQPFTNAISLLAQSAETLENELASIANGGDFNTAGRRIYGHLSNTNGITSKINNRNFFKSVELIQQNFSALISPENPEEHLTKEAKNKIEKFTDLYDKFISDQTPQNALPLLFNARILQNTLQTLESALQLFNESIDAHNVPSSDETSLSLLLPALLDIRQFAQRLMAIQELYTELCMLQSIPESSHPLRISKIESGSLWIKVFGESKTIEMIQSFLTKSASWIYRNYTNEGKIQAIPQKVDAIDALLGLRTRLAEAGLDTSEMEENINKSAISISKSLSTILNGQPSITVNNQTISAAQEHTKLFISQNTPLHLPNPIETKTLETIPNPQKN